MYLASIKCGPYDDTEAWEIELMPATLIIGHPKYGGDDSIELLSDSIQYDNYNGLMDSLIIYEGPFPEDDCEKLKKYFSSVYGLIIAQNIGSKCHYTQLKSMWDAILESVIYNGTQIIATTQNYETIETFANVLLKHKDLNLGKVCRIHKNRHSLNHEVISYSVSALETVLEYNWDVR